MAGNVWEWVADWYNVYPGGDAGTNTLLDKTYWVLCGGGWNVKLENNIRIGSMDQKTILPLFSKRLINGTALFLGTIISFVAVLILPSLFYRFDVRAFWEWGACWKTNWHDIYVLCPTANYPIIGMIGTGGVMSLMMEYGFEKAALIYRLFLAVFDGLNVLLFWWIAQRLKIEWATFGAGLVGLSLSSWATGALWGQIEGISQFFIFLSLASMLPFARRTTSLTKFKFGLCLTISALWMACGILTKQLTIFTILPLFSMLILGIFPYVRSWKWRSIYAISTTGLFLVGLTVGDLFFRPPAGFFSNLYYAWSKGNNNANDPLSVNGFNIWIFLGRDPESSALISIFSKQMPSSAFDLIFTPKIVGIALVVGFIAFVAVQLLGPLKTWREHIHSPWNRGTVIKWIYFIAMINLSVNIFLSGTHERYLYHFYPLVFFACLGLTQYNHDPASSRRLFLLLTGGSLLYGLFILVTLSRLDFGYTADYFLHIVVGVYHVGLLIYLTMLSQKFRQISIPD